MNIDWNPMDSPVFKGLYTHGVVAAVFSVATNPALGQALTSAAGAWAPLVNLLIVGLTMHAGSLALAPTPTDPIAVLAKDAANVAVAALPQVPK